MLKHVSHLPMALLAAGISANAATYYVALTGNDSNVCSQGNACRTFIRAYQVANGGDTVEVAAGTYADPRFVNLTPKTSTIMFRPAAGATVVLQNLTVKGAARIELNDFSVVGVWDLEDSNNIVFRRVKVTSGSSTTAAFIRNTQNSSFYDCEIGNIDPGDGLQIWPSPNGNNDNLLFDGLWIHDLTRRNDPSYHQDGIQMISGNNVRFNRLRMYNVSTQGFYTQPDISPGSISNLTVENSWFGKVPEGYYIMHLRMAGNNFTIRNNTFVDAVYVQDVSGVRFVGNFFAGFAGNSSGCSVLRGNVTEFSYNVINENCPGADSTNKSVIGSRTSLVNPDPSSSAGFDLHLKAGSPAIDAASPSNFPPADIDGNPRPIGARADAGAHEFGGTTAPPPNPPTGLVCTVN